MPNKKRWEWGVRYPNGYVEVFGTGLSGKKQAKAAMAKGDKLQRRFVGRWRDA